MRGSFLLLLAVLLAVMLGVGAASLGKALRNDPAPRVGGDPCLPIPTGGDPRLQEAA